MLGFTDNRVHHRSTQKYLKDSNVPAIAARSTSWSTSSRVSLLTAISPRNSPSGSNPSRALAGLAYPELTFITPRFLDKTRESAYTCTVNKNNDQQEHVGENVCLFSALNSHHAANSLRRKANRMMR